MIDVLLGSLADRVISLLKRREEVDKALFDQTVKPAMDDLEKLHATYLERFAQYRALVEAATPQDWSPAALIERIRRDALYGATSESWIAQLNTVELGHAVADAFLREVVGYLASARAMLALPPGRPVKSEEFATQIVLPRIEGFLADFEAPASQEDVRRQQAFILRIIDVTVRLLQEKHARVVGEFWQARARLAIPR
jgi:hypothetical protein